MPALTRYTQELFGTDAGANEMAEFGSLVTDPPGNLYSGSTITPEIVQNSSAFQGGLYAAVGGAYSPTIQDMNSLLYNLFYQATYILQNGIPGWDAGTTYFQNQFCSLAGLIYVSLVNDNLNNNPGSSPTEWAVYPNANIAPTQQKFTSGSGTYTLPTSPRKPLYLRVQLRAGGGGGGGTSDSGSGQIGTAGSPSEFSASIGATGGSPGDSDDPSGGAGGIASFSGTGVFGVAYDGARGGASQTSAAGAGLWAGGMGGQSFGGASATPSGKAALANSGGGGSGGSASDNAMPLYAGSGGGGGGYLDVIIRNPDETYAYTVGAGGTGGSSSYSAGGNGGSGIIIVTEYYQ